MDLSARDRRRVGHHLRHELEKIEPEARRVPNAKLDRVRLIRHETLHQCLALCRDFLQLRRKDERVPCGLHQFVGHISPQVIVRACTRSRWSAVSPFCPARPCFLYSSSQRFSRLVVGSPSKVHAMLPFSSNGGSASIALNSMVSSIVSPSKGRFK